MLIYHPVEDSTHCCYRLIRLLDGIKSESVSQSVLMICDFYSLFPGQLKKIRGWPRAKSASWKILQDMPDEYEEMLNTKRVFFQLKEIQAAAISYLHAKEIISISSTVDRDIRLNRDAIPLKIREVLENDTFNSSAWLPVITKELSQLELFGKNGLKSKTGLMEFLYD